MSEGKLPEGWVNTEIGDIAEIISGGTPKSGNASNFAPTGEGIAWLTPADLSGYKKKCIARGARDLSIDGYSSCSAKLMQAGAILFSSRAPIGYVAVASNEIATNQGFKSFVFTDDIYTDYAYYYLRNIRHLAEEKGTGTTFKEISGSSAKTLPFVIAPLAEQKCIAEKLDTLLAQVDSTKVRLEKIPKILKRFRQAVLGAAVSGKLTESFRQNSNYSSYTLFLSKEEKNIQYAELWGKYQLKDCCTIISGNAFKSSNFTINGDVPVVKISNIQYGEFEIKNQEYLSYEYLEKYGSFKVVANDILMALTRPVTNNQLKVCRYPHSKPVGLLNQRVCRFIFNENINSGFFELLFQSEYFKVQILDNLSETLQPNLSPIDLRNFTVFIPPLPEQAEIVRRVEQLFAYADTIEKQVNNALARVNNLTQSILAKAFRGELTAQWRAENPELISGENSAAALLEKIKAERAASTGKKASRKKS